MCFDLNAVAIWQRNHLCYRHSKDLSSSTGEGVGRRKGWDIYSSPFWNFLVKWGLLQRWQNGDIFCNCWHALVTSFYGLHPACMLYIEVHCTQGFFCNNLSASRGKVGMPLIALIFAWVVQVPRNIRGCVNLLPMATNDLLDFACNTYILLDTVVNVTHEHTLFLCLVSLLIARYTLSKWTWIIVVVGYLSSGTFKLWSCRELEH